MKAGIEGARNSGSNFDASRQQARMGNAEPMMAWYGHQRGLRDNEAARRALGLDKLPTSSGATDTISIRTMSRRGCDNARSIAADYNEYLYNSEVLLILKNSLVPQSRFLSEWFPSPSACFFLRKAQKVTH